MNLKRIIREEMDDFDWIKEIGPIDTVAFFKVNDSYNMSVLYHGKSDWSEFIFRGYYPDGKSHTYDDGRGSLIFDDLSNGSSAYFTPLYIETMLEKYNLTLFDLMY